MADKIVKNEVIKIYIINAEILISSCWNFHKFPWLYDLQT